jgi:choline dehydrogenase-like flavoprotein
MKSLALILGLFGSVPAEPFGWFPSSSKGPFARRAEADLQLSSGSISSSPASFAKASYDYIVVGGGTAGLALAVRLSECGKHTVGVLEAGISGFGDPIIDIPGNFGADVGTIYDCMSFAILRIYLVLNDPCPGNYTTVRGTGANAGVPSTNWARGKVGAMSLDTDAANPIDLQVLGGSSALNYLLWDRASTVEYDAWEKLGNIGWVSEPPSGKTIADPHQFTELEVYVQVYENG